MILGGDGINLSESFDEILGVTVAVTRSGCDYDEVRVPYVMSISTTHTQDWFVVDLEEGGFWVLSPYRFEELAESYEPFPTFREAFFYTVSHVLEESLNVLKEKSVDRSPLLG